MRSLSFSALLPLLFACSADSLPGGGRGGGVPPDVEEKAPTAPPEPADEGAAENAGGPIRGLASAPLGFVQDRETVPTGTIAVTLTDAPGDFEAVPVTIGRVEAHALVPADTGGEPDEDAGWLVLADQPQELDLLTLQDGVRALLGSATVPAGGYDQVRLIVSAAAVVVDGERHDLHVPSGEQTGFKLDYDYNVEEGVEHELRLDFDAHESVRRVGHGYQLQPHITVAYFGPATDLPEEQPADSGLAP